MLSKSQRVMKWMHLFVFFSSHFNGIIYVINILYFLLYFLKFCINSHSFQNSTRIINALIILILQTGKQKDKEASSLPCGKFIERSRKQAKRTVDRKVLLLAEFTSKSVFLAFCVSKVSKKQFILQREKSILAPILNVVLNYFHSFFFLNFLFLPPPIDFFSFIFISWRLITS